jgi:DNA-binding GntR family transcriptional regulator
MASTERRGVPAEAALQAYRQLREAIVSSRFQPNERLVEADLMRFLDAGRSTVRAALVRLDQEGLVTHEPNRGARVRLVSAEEALEIEEARAALEQLAVRQAALRITPQHLAALHADLDEMRARVEEGDPLAYSELNARFHERIWSIAGNATVARLLASLKSQSLRFQYGTILQPGRPHRSLREHEAIVAALASGDADAGEAAMREHLGHVLDTLTAAIARARASDSQETWANRPF